MSFLPWEKFRYMSRNLRSDWFVNVDGIRLDNVWDIMPPRQVCLIHSGACISTDCHLLCVLANIFFHQILYLVSRVPWIRSLVIIMKDSAANFKDCFIFITFHERCKNDASLPNLQRTLSRKHHIIIDLRKANHTVPKVQRKL